MFFVGKKKRKNLVTDEMLIARIKIDHGLQLESRISQRVYLQMITKWRKILIDRLLLRMINIISAAWQCSKVTIDLASLNYFLNQIIWSIKLAT